MTGACLSLGSLGPALVQSAQLQCQGHVHLARKLPRFSRGPALTRFGTSHLSFATQAARQRGQRRRPPPAMCLVGKGGTAHWFSLLLIGKCCTHANPNAKL